MTAAETVREAARADPRLRNKVPAAAASRPMTGQRATSSLATNPAGTIDPNAKTSSHET
jgi:hypothetical protein